jgi:hypothetical protein
MARSDRMKRRLRRGEKPLMQVGAAHNRAMARARIGRGGDIGRSAGRMPTAVELAVLGQREPCPLAGNCCPVPPDCHICGLTKKELEMIRRHNGNGIQGQAVRSAGRTQAAAPDE